MNIRTIFSALLLALPLVAPAQTADYRESPEYLVLRDSMHHGFNDGDSARFYVAVRNLEKFLLAKNDLHAYYTQRCNEIVFELNRMNIFEAYKGAQQLSKELTEKKLDKEMYMAVNMMGHVYNYCGDKVLAKQCFWDVIRLMEKEGYTESIPPIYMNLVNIVIDEDPQEALKLIDKALEIAKETSPTRVFDIEARRTLAYYNMNDTANFVKGYKAFKEGVAQGLSSVHGRQLEIRWQIYNGNIDEAIRLASELSDNPYETEAEVYSQVGRWREAFEALKLGAKETDSINSILLTSSMQGIKNELEMYEVRREQSRVMFFSMVIVISMLLLLIAALVYIVHSRRRHWNQMERAYKRVLDAEKMKAEFIQNVSHEVRTPLNIISGFAQVLAAPNNNITQDERRHISETMMHNTRIITTMINEVLEIARGDSYDKEVELQPFRCNELLQHVVEVFCKDRLRQKELLQFESQVDDDFVIQSHEQFMQRILNPLLDNAYKNLPQKDGQVVVRVAATDKHLEIDIEDNGESIPAKDAERVFERFVKLDPFKEGLGLGLTFSRTMARRMGGDVTLDTSFAGPGCRFKVSLPLN